MVVGDETTSQPNIGELVSRLSEQTTQLVRDEIRLATAEMSKKGKAFGIGAGLFGAAGVFAVYGLGALIAAAVLGLAIVVSGWLAALIVGAALLVVAGATALVGKSNVKHATPPVPTEAVASTKQDIAEVKRGIRS